MAIGKKLILGFGALLVVALVLAVANLYSASSLGGEIRRANEVTARKIFLISEIQGQLYRMRTSVRGIMLFSLMSDPERVRGAKADFDSRAASVENLIGQLSPLVATERGKNDIASMVSGLPSYRTHAEDVARLTLAGNSKGAMEAYQNLFKDADALDAPALDLVEIQKQLTAQSSERGATASLRARWTAYLMGLGALSVAPFLLLLVTRTTRDLRGVASNLHDGAEQITSAAGQVASSSQTLAQGASEQAASLEETSSSSEEITSMTRKNAENSQTAAAVMAEVDQRVTEGNRTLEEMVQSMQEITGSSDKISKIIKVIDEIAFQTNILALNAAVEAARAGEAGMGFAVVADEVRNLAQRSAQAAKDTASLIEDSIAKSNQGSQRLEHVAQVIHAITESAGKVKTLVDEVNLGSQEQARGIEQISKSIAEMDRVTQANAASAEQSASASEQMSAQAEALQNIARELRTLVGGGGGDHADNHTDQRAYAPRASAKTRRAGSVAPKTADLGALRSAVSPAPANGVAPAKLQLPSPAASNAIPLEDDFVNM
jgi:methyl-accepting chemotaxis protein